MTRLLPCRKLAQYRKPCKQVRPASTLRKRVDLKFDHSQQQTQCTGAQSLESLIFPVLHMHGPSAGQDLGAFDWLTHSITCGRHIDALGFAAQTYSTFCMQPVQTTGAQEQQLIDAEVALEISLEAERCESAARPCADKCAHATNDRCTPGRVGPGSQRPGGALGNILPLQASHVLPATVTPQESTIANPGLACLGRATLSHGHQPRLLGAVQKTVYPPEGVATRTLCSGEQIP